MVVSENSRYDRFFQLSSLSMPITQQQQSAVICYQLSQDMLQHEQWHKKQLEMSPYYIYFT